MAKRKLGIILGLLLIILVVAGIGFLIWQMVSRQAVFVPNQPPDLAATPQNLKYVGLQFDPISVSDPRAHGAIAGGQALAVALKGEPDLKKATRVTRMLGELHDLNLEGAAKAGLPVDPAKADMGLVWIVTFEGIDTASSGPSGAPRIVAHEYNVVINAKIGGIIMAFPLADISPTAP
jgi:hypothetical protein